MGRRRRFSGLEATLKNLQDATTGDFDPASLPANSVISNYVKFKTGETQMTVTRTPESKPGELIEKALIPFGVMNADGTIAVLCSKRSFDAIASLGVSVTDLNLEDLTVEVPLSGFSPAKAIIFKSDATQATTKVDSQITGRKYDPREGASYTLPFGQKTGGTTAADITYSGVAAGIRASMGVGENVSFEPEYFPLGRG